MFSVKFGYPDKEKLETISSTALNDFGCKSILEDQLDESEVDNLLGEKSFCGGDVPLDVILKLENAQISNPEYYFEKLENAEKFQLWLSNEMMIEAKIYEIVEKDWNLEWKKHYQIISFDDKFHIVPEWILPPSDGKPYLLLNPGLGFGTGTHPTTFGCIKALIELEPVLSKMKCNVLDLGCGSGILGAAFLKLYHGHVAFCDIDEDALENCKNNLFINNLLSIKNSNIGIFLRKEIKNGGYDLVFANILLDVLIGEAEFIKRTTFKGSIIIFSGILKEQKEELSNIYLNYFPFEILNEFSINEWITLIIRRTK